MIVSLFERIERIERRVVSSVSTEKGRKRQSGSVSLLRQRVVVEERGDHHHPLNPHPPILPS